MFVLHVFGHGDSCTLKCTSWSTVIIVMVIERPLDVRATRPAYVSEKLDALVPGLYVPSLYSLLAVVTAFMPSWPRISLTLEESSCFACCHDYSAFSPTSPSTFFGYLLSLWSDEQAPWLSWPIISLQ